jgi:hypothetical protein
MRLTPWTLLFGKHEQALQMGRIDDHAAHDDGWHRTQTGLSTATEI